MLTENSEMRADKKISGNIGEWSEIYVFFKLLADGRLFAADDALNKLEGEYYPIIKIIRTEDRNVRKNKEYYTGSNVEIYSDGRLVTKIPSSEFEKEALFLYEQLKLQSGSSLSIEKTESFMREIYVYKLKAPSIDKTDIKIKLNDIHTGYQPTVGFSIKSYIGNKPTLLNTSEHTAFIYKVLDISEESANNVNKIDSNNKIRNRISAILQCGGRLAYERTKSDIFKNNLFMIDSSMPQLLSEILLAYYQGKGSSCLDLLSFLQEKNPLSRNEKFYEHKFKELLCSIALGLKPGTEWNGTDDANGGYIIVKECGEVLAYHIYNRDSFKNYLLKSTKFDTPSSSRYNFGKLYKENNGTYIKLNFQIRFK